MAKNWRKFLERVSEKEADFDFIFNPKKESSIPNFKKNATGDLVKYELFFCSSIFLPFYIFAKLGSRQPRTIADKFAIHYGSCALKFLHCIP